MWRRSPPAWLVSALLIRGSGASDAKGSGSAPEDSCVATGMSAQCGPPRNRRCCKSHAGPWWANLLGEWGQFRLLNLGPSLAPQVYKHKHPNMRAGLRHGLPTDRGRPCPQTPSLRRRRQKKKNLDIATVLKGGRASSLSPDASCDSVRFVLVAQRYSTATPCRGLLQC